METLTREILIVENNEKAMEFMCRMRKRSNRDMSIMAFGERINVKIKRVNVFFTMKDTILEIGSRIKDMD
jgi:hypothetical protein